MSVVKETLHVKQWEYINDTNDLLVTTVDNRQVLFTKVRLLSVDLGGTPLPAGQVVKFTVEHFADLYD